jgi:hypothetical protein
MSNTDTKKNASDPARNGGDANLRWWVMVTAVATLSVCALTWANSISQEISSHAKLISKIETIGQNNVNRLARMEDKIDRVLENQVLRLGNP